MTGGLRICSVHHCGGQVHGKGLCNRHYRQALVGSELKTDKIGTQGSLADRFWRFVDGGGENECWLWRGSLNKAGYGLLHVCRKRLGAHRVSYQVNKGPIPEGQLIRHSCHNPACVNPSHLSPGNHFDNAMDRVAAGRGLVNEAHPNCKFSDEVVSAVRPSSLPRQQIAAQFGMSLSQVGKIKAGAQRPPVNTEAA